MSEATSPFDEDDAALAELVAKDLAAVRHVHAQLMAATGADDVNSLGRTYQRVARSLRQTLALKAKLKRERAQDAAAAPPATERFDRELHDYSIDARIEVIQDAVTRVIDAASRDAPERRQPLYARFDREMDDWNLEDDLFLEEALDDQIERACETLGLPPDLAAGWRTLPKAVWAPDPVGATPGPEPAEARSADVPPADTG